MSNFLYVNMFTIIAVELLRLSDCPIKPNIPSRDKVNGEVFVNHVWRIWSDTPFLQQYALLQKSWYTLQCTSAFRNLSQRASSKGLGVPIYLLNFCQWCSSLLSWFSFRTYIRRGGLGRDWYRVGGVGCGGCEITRVVKYVEACYQFGCWPHANWHHMNSCIIPAVCHCLIVLSVLILFLFHHEPALSGTLHITLLKEIRGAFGC